MDFFYIIYHIESDSNKGIRGIVYNHLSLPINILYLNGDGIEFLYDVNGVKLRKRVSQTIGGALSSKVTQYLDGFQYHQGYLQFFPTSQGYVRATLVKMRYAYNYVFHYTDHLGNIRLSYGLDPATGTVSILEENHYYPFGLKHTNYNSDQLEYSKTAMDNVALQVSPLAIGGPILIDEFGFLGYNYKYNGKELQDELGLNWHDYGARNYNTTIGRWMNIDPLSEKYFCFSPYNYVTNNPIAKYDPDGMDVYFVNDQGKFTLALKEKGKDRLYASTTDELGITKIKAWNSSKDDEGTTFGGIELQNGILSQLTNFKVDKNGYGFYSSVVNQNASTENDMLKLFHFVSNNTEVEFSMNFYKDKNNQNRIVLGTYQTETYSPGSDTYGIHNNSQIIKKYHNHPSNQVSDSERYHMGGDAHNAVNAKTNFPNYVFYPKTTNLYNVTQYSIDFIQKINHDYKKLKH